METTKGVSNIPFDRVIHIAREEGFRGVWRRIVARLCRGLMYRRLIIIVKPLDGTLPQYEPQIPIGFEELTPISSDVEAYLACDRRWSRAEVMDMLCSGQRCTVGKYEGQIVYAVWSIVQEFDIGFLQRSFQLAGDEIYFARAYTAPGFRGKGIHPAGFCEGLRLAKEEGFKRVIGLIEPGNHAAMRITQKLNWDIVGSTGFIQVAGLRWYFHKDKGVFRALQQRSYWAKA